MLPIRTMALIGLMATPLGGELVPSSSARPVIIKLGTVAPEGSTWHDILLTIREEWRELSGGEVELRIYAGGVLGGEAEMVRKMRRRGLDAVALSGAGLPRIEKGINSLNLPMLFESYEELDYVRTRMAPELERRVEEQGFKILNWSDAGWVYFFTTKPVRTPDDLRQIRLWTSSGDPETERLFKDMGFTVVPLSATDMLTSLQTGLLEAIDVPPLFALLDRTYVIANHMLDLKWASLMAAVVISQQSWERIPKAQREPLLEAARTAGRELREEVRRSGEEAISEMKSRGLTVIELDEPARRAWREEVDEAYPELRGTLAPIELFDQVIQLRDEFRQTQSR